jgi:hypothetical protein
MISDSNSLSKRRLTRRSNDAEGKWWSDSQKLETVKTYLMTGNIAMTARILKIPDDTVRRWVKTTWWAEIVDELRSQDELVLSARLQKIVHKSLDVVEDRLEKGDYVYDQKSGKMRRKPMSGRDAHKIMMDSHSKRDLVLDRAAPQVSDEQVADKLLKLAERFAELAGVKKLESNTLDMGVVDVEVDETPDNADLVFSDPEPEGSSELVQEDEEGRPVV